ncbi:SCO7613 C-terminal domain-containing membrane protein [Ornithinibacillus bavariensis]|uniref:SCO7613 C-terminal domain-containing membrane protein n=1 Tax=Ornithinibacillus bavariensis TaxID=545502 RepID=UPI000EBE2E1F|nr:hypothetical protein [Ornithinibacillus sp.]
MTQLSPEEKREIVREELNKLVKARYLSLNIAAKVVNSHTKYYSNLPKGNQIEQDTKIPKQEAPKPQMNSIRQTKEAPKPQMNSITQTKEELQKEVKQTVPSQPVIKSKKELTAKQVRERNITWGLNLGVILLLLGGLVLATSTWEMLGNWTKTGLIAAVSVLFYTLAWLTSRVLHIKKTGFAFIVLGSLFLPIIVVSAGYFELFGSYLSFSGEGKYLFGAIGTLVILPIYAFLAIKLASRLFVWFSYVTLSVLVGLVIAALHLPIDGFYFSIMLYNALLILGYRTFKNHHKLTLFLKEFIPFIQANLILSTLLMLVFYDSEVMYSFNLLLTAVIYFAMIFVSNHRSYHFVFTAMLIYGAYQLVENSILEGVGEIAYALLGVIFLALPKLIKDSGSLHKIFRITSAVVSAMAFLYISLEGILLRAGVGSIILMIAYIIIALNFTYLASTVKNKLFTYLSPIFLVSAIYELALLGKLWFNYDSITFPFYLFVFLFYLVGGCFVNIALWKPIKESSRDISGLMLIITLFIALLDSTKFIQSLMFFILGLTAIVMNHYENRVAMKKIAPWLHPVSIALFIITIHAHFMKPTNAMFIEEPIQVVGVIFGSLFVLTASYIWKKSSWINFSSSSFYTAQIFYGLGIIFSLSFGLESITRAFIYLGGIGMAYLLYRKTNWAAIPYIMSSISVIFYFSVLVVLHTELTQIPTLFEWFEFVIGAIALLGLGLTIRNQEQRLMKAYYWVGQIYLPISLFISLFLLGTDSLWAFLLTTVIYGITVKMVRTEWQIKTYLYAGFTTAWISLVLLFSKLEWWEGIPYTYLIISVLLLVSWFICNEVWKKRIVYYFLPFSSVGIASFYISYPYEIDLFMITLLYGSLVLLVLHRMKWDVISIIPLLFMYAAVMKFAENDYLVDYELVVHAGFGIILVVVGRILYSHLYEHKKNNTRLDWYTLMAFITFLNSYQYSFGNEMLVYKILPGILIVILLFMNRNRITDIPSKWMVFAASVFLLQPYYVLLGHVELPDLFVREFYVLPWIIVVIVLRCYVMKDKKTITNYIQWAVLVIVAILLVQDGLQSNTIYDALIIGVLSLVSLIAGMIYQTKSFFFIGAGVLLFNVFMQTRPYWGKLPWWGYLLIAGSILIAIASYNEWQKQKSSEGKETLVSRFRKNVIERIKKWD